MAIRSFLHICVTRIKKITMAKAAALVRYVCNGMQHRVIHWLFLPFFLSTSLHSSLSKFTFSQIHCNSIYIDRSCLWSRASIHPSIPIKYSPCIVVFVCIVHTNNRFIHLKQMHTQTIYICINGSIRSTTSEKKTIFNTIPLCNVYRN